MGHVEIEKILSCPFKGFNILLCQAILCLLKYLPAREFSMQFLFKAISSMRTYALQNSGHPSWKGDVSNGLLK